jgi:hypothetical protein
MADSSAWLKQASSDLETAKILQSNVEPMLYCQVAAKCQQTIEKSIKAIATELADRRIVFLTVGIDHRIDQYIAAILRAPGNKSGTVPHFLKSTIHNNRSTIDELMRLAPSGRAEDGRLPKNTEYPFHNHHGELVAPADEDVFELPDVGRYINAASSLFEKASALIGITARTPR